jgi:hypothetical protein
VLPVGDDPGADVGGKKPDDARIAWRSGRMALNRWVASVAPV